MTFRLTRAALLAVVGGDATFASAIADRTIAAEGDVAASDMIFANLDTFLTNFNLVEP